VSELDHMMLLNDERNSLTYWYPKVVETGVPTPKTVWVDLSRWLGRKGSILSWLLEGLPPSLVSELRKTADSMGYPVFMRTDHFSGKHHYSETCYVETRDDLIYNLKNLLDYSIMLGLRVGAIVFREMLELDYRYRAFQGLPIAPEVRYFIRDGVVEEWFFYWPEDAIQLPDREDWKDLHSEMRELCKEEEDIHRKLVERVAKKFDGYWSVDFARLRDGRWVLIDMALGEVSWHPKRSKNG